MAIPIFQANLLQLAGSNWQQNNSTKCARRALCFIVWNAAGRSGEGRGVYGRRRRGAALGNWEHVWLYKCACMCVDTSLQNQRRQPELYMYLSQSLSLCLPLFLSLSHSLRPSLSFPLYLLLFRSLCNNC